MRVLIFLLLLVGGAAAVFYETKVNRVAQQRIEAAPSVPHAYGTDEVDNGSRGKDENTWFGLNDPGASDPMVEDDGLPAPQRQLEKRSQQAESSRSGSPSPANEAEQTRPPKPFRLSLPLALLLERNEARKASDNLAAVRQDLKTAVRERDELAARVSELGSNTTKLQAAMQVKDDKVADVRQRLTEQTQKDASAGAERAAADSQVTSLKGKADEAVAKQQEAESELARSRTLAESLQTKLADLSAKRDAVANEQNASLAGASRKLALAEAKVRDLTASGSSATVRIAHLMAQQRLEATALWTSRVALANTRASAQQRVAALQSDRARQLAAGNEALRKRSQEANAQVDAAQGEASRAMGAAAALRAQLQGQSLRRASAEAKLSGALAENAKLTARLAATTSDFGGKVADLKKRDASSADQAARLTQLDHDLGEGRKQRAALQKMVANLRSDNAAQVARIDRMNKTASESQAERDTAAQRQSDSMAETAKKLSLAEAKVRDLTADRDAATSRIARVTAQQRLTAASLSAIQVALANERAAAQQQASGPRADGDEAARKRAEGARKQTDETKSASSRATETAAAMKAQLRGLEARRESVEAELAGARAENAKLATLLDTTASDAQAKLADLGRRNTILADQAGRLPQLTHDLDEERKQQGMLSKMLATLKSENEGRLAQMDALRRVGKSNEERLSQTETAYRQRATAEGAQVRKLESTLISVRAELAQTIKDKNVTENARQSSDRALAAVNAKLQAERSRPALLAEKMAKAEQSLPAAVAPTRLRSDDRGSVDERHPVAAVTDRDAVPAALPDTVAAHVLLRYVHDKARSQARAKTLEAALRGLGVEVKDVAAAAIGKPGNSVTYFYAEDQSVADQVARQIAAPAPTRSRGASVEAQRPGTIEVIVGG